jgi:signal peptidase II
MLKLREFIFIFLLFGLDQLSKRLATNFLEFYNPIHLIKSVVSLELVFNYGAAYGILQHQRLFLLIVACVFIVGILMFSNYFIQSKYSKIAVLFLLAGALGNMIDRLLLGYVIDFIDIKVFPVFNFADIFINISIGLFLYEALIYDRKNKKQSS